MPNGTFKYKQDDGSIVELTPVGVDTEARTLATNEATRAKAAEQKLENDKADKSAIPDVSALVTKATYDAGQAAQDKRLDKLENVVYSETTINLTMVPLQKGDLIGERYFISPVPLAASPTPGCYTPTAGDGTGNCFYWCANSTGVHTLTTKATSFEVVDRHLMRINFEEPATDADLFGSAAPIGYTLSGAWPTFMLTLP